MPRHENTASSSGRGRDSYKANNSGNRGHCHHALRKDEESSIRPRKRSSCDSRRRRRGRSWSPGRSSRFSETDRARKRRFSHYSSYKSDLVDNRNPIGSKNSRGGYSGRRAPNLSTVKSNAAASHHSAAGRRRRPLANHSVRQPLDLTWENHVPRRASTSGWSVGHALLRFYVKLVH